MLLQPARCDERLDPRTPPLESLPRHVLEVGIRRVLLRNVEARKGSRTCSIFTWQRWAMSQVRSSASSRPPNIAAISTRVFK